nr:prepilin-type N-terminal cleavage/methylation domain-containing protein [Thermus thalpophilus]
MSGRGISLLELLVALAVLGIAGSIAALNLRPLYNPLQDSVSRTEGYLKQVRAKAMATTSAYRISLRQDGKGLEASYANKCNASTFTTDLQLRLELPTEVTISIRPAGASLCFNSRGLLVLINGGNPPQEPTLTLQDNRGRVATLAVLLGGGVVQR